MRGITSIGATAYRLPDCKCPACAGSLSGSTMVNGDEPPSPGDISICIYCGHILIFADDLTLRNPTDAEAHDIAGDERVLCLQRLRALSPQQRTDER